MTACRCTYTTQVSHVRSMIVLNSVNNVNSECLYTERGKPTPHDMTSSSVKMTGGQRVCMTASI